MSALSVYRWIISLLFGLIAALLPPPFRMVGLGYIQRCHPRSQCECSCSRIYDMVWFHFFLKFLTNPAKTSKQSVPLRQKRARACATAAERRCRTKTIKSMRLATCCRITLTWTQFFTSIPMQKQLVDESDVEKGPQIHFAAVWIMVQTTVRGKKKAWINNIKQLWFGCKAKASRLPCHGEGRKVNQGIIRTFNYRVQSYKGVYIES